MHSVEKQVKPPTTAECAGGRHVECPGQEWVAGIPAVDDATLVPCYCECGCQDRAILRQRVAARHERCQGLINPGRWPYAARCPNPATQVHPTDRDPSVMCDGHVTVEREQGRWPS